MEKLYAERDLELIGKHYARHVLAMTAEDLHSKADIAAELAWRDYQIEQYSSCAKLYLNEIINNDHE